MLQLTDAVLNPPPPRNVNRAQLWESISVPALRHSLVILLCLVHLVLNRTLTHRVLIAVHLLATGRGLGREPGAPLVRDRYLVVLLARGLRWRGLRVASLRPGPAVDAALNALPVELLALRILALTFEV